MKYLLPTDTREFWSVDLPHPGEQSDDEACVILTHKRGGVPATLMTIMRTGVMFLPGGFVHGKAHDWSAVAAYAVRSLLLECVPVGLTRESATEEVERAQLLGATFGEKRESWSATQIEVDGLSFALWKLRLPEGVVAHADLGWATAAMWSQDELPDGPFTYSEAGSVSGLNGGVSNLTSKHDLNALSGEGQFFAGDCEPWE